MSYRLVNRWTDGQLENIMPPLPLGGENLLFGRGLTGQLVLPITLAIILTKVNS